MKVAILGSGGREHALAWKFSQSVGEENVFLLSGNGGTKNNIDIGVNQFPEIKGFCVENKIDLLFVGPEDPLANGIIDYFKGSGIRVFGPDKRAAQLEGSKIYAKEFMGKYGVATADFKEFNDSAASEAYIKELDGKLVIKYDGLAAGKGVFVCSNIDEALKALNEIVTKYGADSKWLIEEKLEGQEISIIGFTDGKDIQLLLPSQDHKPAYDGDTGPNTGGMGAYCPVPFCDEALIEKIKKEIINPTLNGLKTESFDYKGIVYFGIMMSASGPKLLEYNVRFGDPETEVLLPSMKSDIVGLVDACFNGSLKDFKMEFNDGYFVDVVLASGGYPGSYKKGLEIKGLQNVSDEAIVFHAGTKMENGVPVTSGGRVLNVVAQADTLEKAIENSYKACAEIKFDHMYYRKDIANKGLGK
ncbi:phosphoribosylamine--glycine ligase [bacterium]|nr:phosphoribosylamine--glycine ligase [bacterium]